MYKFEVTLDGANTIDCKDKNEQQNRCVDDIE